MNRTVAIFITLFTSSRRRKLSGPFEDIRRPILFDFLPLTYVPSRHLAFPFTFNWILAVFFTAPYPAESTHMPSPDSEDVPQTSFDMLRDSEEVSQMCNERLSLLLPLSVSWYIGNGVWAGRGDMRARITTGICRV